MNVGDWVDTKYGLARVSLTGYRYDSEDVNNSVNLIPSNHISMKDVLFSIICIDNVGNVVILHPEEEYYFQGDYVIEVPIKQR